MIAEDQAKPGGSITSERRSAQLTPSDQPRRLSISVVIPTFNRAAMLAATLESFAAQTLPADQYEVVVVDDGSEDATSQVCRDFASRIQLKYLHIENSGTSVAKNTGILASSGRILLFFDDDDVADSRLLEEHVKAHQQHPEENVAVLGYTTWAPTLPVTPLRRYVTETGRFLFAYGDLKDGQILDFTYFWAGRCSCKRSLLAKHGVFNRQFRAAGIEDIELGYRLSKFGFRVVFHRAAVSYMTRPLTFEGFCDRCERQGEALFLFSQLHDDPVAQQYCQLADPFIENQAVGVDAEARWPAVAALFREKVDQVSRVERLLAWGFEPEAMSEVAESKQTVQAEAYRLQMRELFAKCSELEAQLSDRTAAHQAERNRLAEINGLLHSKSISLAEQEQRGVELTDRLRKQLWSVRKLSRLLDDAEKAAAHLRSSRRWKLANPVAAIEAKLFPGKVSMGYGHLEKIVAAYSEWRASHPEMAKIEDEIRALQFPTVPKWLGVDSEKSTHNLKPVGPPVPLLPVESIHFPTHEDVEVSIIIPVFNQFRYTHACLGSLRTVKDKLRFEVIVVDDCSTDETADLVPRMDGVVYVRSETNAGFIASCNRGAEKARGKFLFFLNNDTIVKEGYLAALVDTFAEEPRLGIVGSKLVYPDGRLQEAGGIIWRDASGWNYGKFDDPEKPEYNYLREVDYCSAAALMIPRSLFESVGGFDPKYAPAYYEDTDLSFKVRGAGYKVLYQPLSEVIHYEGVTGGVDLSTGTKKHQEINRATFAETWAVELMKKPATGDLTFLNQAPPGGKNILVIDHHVPMPDRDSGSLRMFQILKLLHQLGHRVTFIPDNLADIPPYTRKLQKRGIEVIYHPYIKKVRDYLIANGSKFDAVVLSRCDFARKHIADVRLHAPQSRIIFDTVDLHFVRESRGAELADDLELRQKAQEKRRLEYDLIDQADETWVVSSVEHEILKEKWPAKSIEIVSNIVDVPGSATPFSLRRDFLFIGGFQHPPNTDAVLYFAEAIYPLVKEHLSDAKFYIIGEKPPPEVVALATENIIVTGLQTDVRPFFDSVKLSVAPLRFGAGVKGKINQSMAYGVPVVATSLAAEGMMLTDHEDILVADEPGGFARALLELYESEGLWNRLSENGIKRTQSLYSTDAAREKLQALFSDQHLKSLDTSFGPRGLAIGSKA